MEEKLKTKVQAKIVLARCPNVKDKGGNLFGMRIQKYGSDWKRTWAFKIDEEKARHEGYDTETARVSSDTEEYPGCPYCGTKDFICCACGKCFCDSPRKKKKGKQMATCPWCGETLEIVTVDALNLTGGGY